MSFEKSDQSPEISGRTLFGVTEPPFPAPDLRLLDVDASEEEEEDDEDEDEDPDPKEGGSDLEGEYLSLLERKRRLGLSLRFLTNFMEEKYGGERK
ncbi:hypothetical protein TorRG33x02_264610 [Trema orientale]|uniref:Uncharacterized protein n=1 Tax=Trema orientale TaxID=63057 RepID=A0A2P5D299_TREOI|nr:hypothetical protein TorRG33x02_264610 [Trema orientale]